MTYSEIKIQFNEELSQGSGISFLLKSSLYPNEPGLLLSETWVLFRKGKNEVGTLGNVTPTIGERTAINFITSFELDYNGYSIYTITRVGNEVTIKANNPYFQFSDPIAINNEALLNVGFTINNFTGNIFSISSLDFLQASNPCTHVKIRITTSELATELIEPVKIENNTQNPIEFELLKGSGLIWLDLKSSDGQQIRERISIPYLLSSANLSIQVNNSPNGATAIANLKDSYLFNLEYSLDNLNWKDSNTFDSLPPNTYTFYVKDNLGCTVVKSFVVEEFGVSDPYFHISKSNSLRFVKSSEGGVASNKKIDENRLSFEDDVNIVYKETHYFTKDDIDTTQFKSNYSNVSAIAVDEEGNETSLLVNKISNNLRLKDSRDAIRYNYGSGKTGIYFMSGKRYDFDTGFDLDNDYSLNGKLPEWAKSGEYIKIESAWYQIENIIPSGEKQSVVLIIDVPYNGLESIVKVGSIYNRENYEVFEFDLEMLDYLNKNFFVKIVNLDDNFPELTYRSEDISVKENLKDFSEFIYSNDTNTDVFYSTGIQHKFWVKLDDISDKPDGSVKQHVTDTRTILEKGDAFEGKKIKTLPVTRGMMIKVFLSFFHRIFYLDGTKYVVSEVPEVEGRLGDTNLYVINAILRKANETHKSKTFDKSKPASGGFLELPSFIKVDGGYIKI
ncbi:hypothetical protein [Tenacibaculum caenipelagi]|uniref:Uncharacterized protein n=1 Tax=Tenacibaculum caenipelagi TaxID=1325435 RepID=A0A4V3D325_9FLAO|nr:hypothetical protein [Tenacibaculum caenipelagi]TDQ27624.1 hypothetical protein DFQ07_1475 [Tenacibaculum caenipelagi]